MSARADQYGFRKTRIDGVRIRSLIEIETVEGAGTSDDIVRPVFRYFDPEDGSFVAERDLACREASIGMPLSGVAS